MHITYYVESAGDEGLEPATPRVVAAEPIPVPTLPMSKLSLEGKQAILMQRTWTKSYENIVKQ